MALGSIFRMVQLWAFFRPLPLYTMLKITIPCSSNFISLASHGNLLQRRFATSITWTTGVYNICIESALQKLLRHGITHELHWYSYQSWKIDCCINPNKGTGRSWLQTSGNQVSQCSVYTLQAPQLSSLCIQEFHHDCHMILDVT